LAERKGENPSARAGRKLQSLQRGSVSGAAVVRRCARTRSQKAVARVWPQQGLGKQHHVTAMKCGKKRKASPLTTATPSVTVMRLSRAQLAPLGPISVQCQLGTDTPSLLRFADRGLSIQPRKPRLSKWVERHPPQQLQLPGKEPLHRKLPRPPLTLSSSRAV